MLIVVKYAIIYRIYTDLLLFLISYTQVTSFINYRGLLIMNLQKAQTLRLGFFMTISEMDFYLN